MIHVRKIKSLENQKYIWMKSAPFRAFKRGVGRNNQGRITSRFRGGGCSRSYRPLMSNYKGIVECLGLFYDPNRRAFLAIVETRYKNIKRNKWIIAPTRFSTQHPNNFIEFCNDDTKLSICRKRLISFVVNQKVHCVAVKPGNNIPAIIARSAGTYSTIVSINKRKNQVKILLPSGQHVLLSGNCLATRGTVSNSEHYLLKYKKAGQNRHLGWRPHVRGVAINPIDHPHGGRTSGGRPSVSPWGKLTKRQKSKNSKIQMNK